MAKTKAQIVIPRAVDFPYEERTIQIKGTKEQVEGAKKEIYSLIGGYMNPGMYRDPRMFGMPPFRMWNLKTI